MYHLSFLFDFICMSSTDRGGKIKPYICKEGILLLQTVSHLYYKIVFLLSSSSCEPLVSFKHRDCAGFLVLALPCCSHSDRVTPILPLVR